jgi:hypothetical protein
VYRHQATTAVIHPQPGQGYAAFGSGFILIGGRPSRGPRHYWVPGHYEWVRRDVWVPGQWYEEYVPPVYRTQIVNGRRTLVLVEPERYERYYVPPHYETVSEQVWVPGYWARRW